MYSIFVCLNVAQANLFQDVSVLVKVSNHSLIAIRVIWRQCFGQMSPFHFERVSTCRLS